MVGRRRQGQWELNNYKLQGREKPKTDCTGPRKLDPPPPTGPASVCLWHENITSCLALDLTDKQGSQEGILCIQ